LTKSCLTVWNITWEFSTKAMKILEKTLWMSKIKTETTEMMEKTPKIKRPRQRKIKTLSQSLNQSLKEKIIRLSPNKNQNVNNNEMIHIHL